MIDIHSEALSEPLYIFLSLASFLCILEFIKIKKTGVLVASAILTALALLTRYAGISLVFAGVAIILICLNDNIKSRIKNSGLFFIISIVPLAIYVFHKIFMNKQAFGQRFVDLRYMVEEKRIINAIYNILAWFIPGRILKGRELLIFLGIVLIFAGVLSVYKLRRAQTFDALFKRIFSSPLVIGLITWIIANLLLLYAGQGLLFGKGNAFNNRYLSPINIATIILLVSMFYIFWEFHERILRIFILLACLLLFVMNAYKAYDRITFLNQNGIGYASTRWHISETIAYLNKNPEIPVMSTGNVGIYFWTGRLPISISNIDATHKWLQKTGGYLVIIDSMPPELYGVNTSDLVRGLNLVYRFSEGSIYQYP